MVSGKPFQAQYFSAIKGCVHAVYEYAITFEGLSVIDLPKSLDYSMLSFRQSEQRNDDILARALSKDQLQRAFSWCNDHNDDLPTLALWLNFYLALRFSELYGLRWCDIQEKERFVHVCGQMDKRGHTRLNHTKKGTAEGIRDIPMTDEAVRIFQRIVLQKPDKASRTDLIFPAGGYYTYRRCRDCFRYALETDIVPDHYVTHTIRSTAASIWYAHGMPPKTIQRLLGHTTTNMTLRYCHDLSTPDEMRDAIASAMAV